MFLSLGRVMMRGGLFPYALLMLFAAMPLFLWLAAAGIALITLRKGSVSGAVALLSAIVAAAMPIVLGDSSAQLSQLTDLGRELGPEVDLRYFEGIRNLQFLNDLVVLVLTYVSANLLRITVNLNHAVLAVCLLIVATIGLRIVPIDQWMELFVAQFQLIGQQLGELYEAEFAKLTDKSEPLLLNYVVGQYLSFSLLAQTLTALFLGRWWQAALYNPGGFGQEFRQLNYGWPVATLLVSLMLLLDFADPRMAGVGWLFLMPLILVGLAIVHTYFAERQGGGKGLLIGFYILLPLTYTFVAIVGWFDSLLDLRKKIGRLRSGNLNS